MSFITISPSAELMRTVWVDRLPSLLYKYVMAVGDFRWNDANLRHATQHGVTPEEAEHVVRFARRPYPQPHRRGTWIVIGRGNSNRMVRVVYLLDPDDTVYVIHAMPLGGRRRSRGK